MKKARPLELSFYPYFSAFPHGEYKSVIPINRHMIDRGVPQLRIKTDDRRL